MSITDDNAPGYKTLGIRLAPDTHAQLSFIAALRPGKGTITDEIQVAIAAHIQAAKLDPNLKGRADAARAEIEREAAARQAAIATLFASEVDSGSKPPPSRRTTKGGTTPPAT